MDTKKPSGQDFRKQRRERDSAAAMRERERDGDKVLALHARLGAAPLDPVHNLAWLGNACAGLAEIVLADPVMPLEEKIKQVRDLTRAAGDVKDAAAISERIKQLEEARGLAKKEKPDGLDPLPARRSPPQA